MKLRLFVSLFCLLAFSAAIAQKPLDYFDRVDVFGNIELVLVKGDNPSYTADPETDDLKIKLEDGRLKISHKQNEERWNRAIQIQGLARGR